MHQYPDYTIEEVDSVLRRTHANTNHVCLICGQAPSYRIIPHNGTPLTAEIQDRGFVCQHCVDMKYLSPAQYGLRPLKRS